MASPRLADFGDAARAGGPPKTILTPPPPPAPPPPATRRPQGVASPRTPLDGGFDRPPPPTRTPPTRTPVGMSAPVVPQHRNDMLHKMLKGLEDDSLTVADVLGVLETELRSGAPTAAPLSEQFERYLGPLSEFSGSAPGPGPGSKLPGNMPRGLSPAPGSAPLLGPTPAALAAPQHQRSVSPAAGAARNGGGQEGAQHFVVNCARCSVLDQQVKALAQSLSGLGARMFNWSLAHCRENTERNGLWHLVLKYLQPVSTVDARIAETCTGLQAAVGTSVADPMPGPPPNHKRGGRRNNAGKGMLVGGAPGHGDDGHVWHPPGGHDSTTAGGRAPRFAESMGHMAAAPESLTASQRSPMRSPLDKEAMSRNQVSSPSSSSRTQVERHRKVHIAEVENGQVDVQEAPTRLRRALPDPEHTRAMPVLPYSPPLPMQPPTSAFQAGAAQPPNEVSVRFGASQLSRKLNGIYQRVIGATSNGRQLYNRGQKYLLHLSDGTWAIKDGPEADLDADVYAYVKDDATEPYNVQRPWQVPADGDGFVTDSKSAVTPGRSDHAEAAAAQAVRKQVHDVASSGAGRKPGAKAEAASDKREATEHWQKDARERGAPRIRVTVVSASGLASSDVFGKADPFVVCQVPGKPLTKFPTPHINDTLNPRWDHQEEVVGWEVGDLLQFTVYDKDTGSASDVLGVAELVPEDFWPDGFDGEVTLDGTAKGIISKLRLRVFVLERGKPGFVKAQHHSQAPPAAVAAQERCPACGTFNTSDANFCQKCGRKQQAGGSSDIDEYEEEWDEDWNVQDAFAERRRGSDRAEEASQQDEESDEEDYDMDEDELQLYKAAFEKLDTDRSGKIDLEELKDNVDVLGVQVSAKELKQFAEHVDKDRDGIDFDEFLDLVQHFHDLEVLNLKRTFEEFDKDRSGTVDMQELYEVFAGAGAGISDAEIQGMMNDADVNDDGVVDFHEFRHLMRLIRQNAAAHKQASGDTLGEADERKAERKKNTLSPSDRNRVKAYLKRKGFNSEDVNSQRKMGTGLSKKGFETPLHTAASENLSDMVWLLLVSKADPVAHNSAGLTPMNIAVKADKKGSHKAVIQHLEEYMVDSEAEEEEEDEAPMPMVAQPSIRHTM